jgi:hypothetical protein
MSETELYIAILLAVLALLILGFGFLVGSALYKNATWAGDEF